jgi:hypothetical protein
MYCPHCGAENVRETKFCRSCGEDLRLVAQAVTKSLPLVIAQRVDEAIDRGRGGWRNYQLFRAENRRPYGQMLTSLCALFMVVWTLLLGHGSVPFAAGFLLVMTAALLLSSVRELLERKRRRRPEGGADRLAASFSTKELAEAEEPPVASITESTTRELKARAARSRGDGLTDQ